MFNFLRFMNVNQFGNINFNQNIIKLNFHKASWFESKASS